MGAVAIWSMHFIGNRAILMAHGEPSLQIRYSPGFTAGSFFLPVCVVAVAFYLFSVSEQVSILGTMVGGLLVGSAVCGMHYMGQKGIANYTPSYVWRRVLGSAIIAVVANTVALGVFFYFKSAWTNSWWKRLSCSSLLAVSVSGMHWVATVGTSYRTKSDMIEKVSGLSREATVVVVICLVSVLPSMSHSPPTELEFLRLLAVASYSSYSQSSVNVHGSNPPTEPSKLCWPAQYLTLKGGSWSHQKAYCHVERSRIHTTKGCVL